MAHGQPDFGVTAAKETIYSVNDLGELAARLGSVMRYNRSGNVLWYDDFRESIAKWTPTYSGGTGSWVTSSAKALISGTSGLLTTPAMSGSLARIETDLVYPVPGKIGFEVAMTQASKTSPIDIILEAITSTQWFYWKIRYAYATGILSLWGSDGAWHTISTSIYLTILTKGFHHFKLIVDLATGKYVSFRVNNYSFDISSYSAQDAGGGANPMLRATIEITTIDIVFPTTAYIGAAIITQNEA